MAQPSVWPLPDPYKAEPPPDTLSDQNDIHAWVELFQKRKIWAEKIFSDCGLMSSESRSRFKEMYGIVKSINAATVNLAGHITTLDDKFAEAQPWARDQIKEGEHLTSQMEISLALLRSIPSDPAILQFILGQDLSPRKDEPCLADLIDIKGAREARSVIERLVKRLKTELDDLSYDFTRLSADVANVTQREEANAVASSTEKSSECVQLLQDIKAVVTKVQNDYESVLGLPVNQKSVSQASKTALLHTRNYLPSLFKRAHEMDGILMTVSKARNGAAKNHMEILRDVAKLNTLCTGMLQKVDNIDLTQEDEQAVQLLIFVDRLPAIYASFIAEAIRRREWMEKIKTDSSTLANEMANFQDEEMRRRKKWQKAFGGYFWQDKPEYNVMGLEVNLLGEEDQLPNVTRQDLEELLAILQRHKGKPETIDEITKTINDLNNPTKQQTRRAKAFKAGSFHEATLGRSALLVRGDDDLIRAFQDEKVKLESKLKGSESRVRKLESLLHQQGQASRSSAGNIFQLPSSISPDSQDANNMIGSPRFNELPSRPPSVASRRYSSNKSIDEKAFTSKMIALESEIIAERERSSGLEKEASAKSTVIKDLKFAIEEANSTKKDLMENLEAQQREFGTERTSLEAEIKRLKGRVEDYEDDIDRILGSRENSKLDVDEQVHAVKLEFSRYRNEATAEAQKAHGQIDFLRNDAQMQREMNDSLERQLKTSRAEIADLKSRTLNAELASLEQGKMLQRLYKILLPNSNLPAENEDLAEALFAKCKDLIAAVDIHQHDLTLLRTDHGTMQGLLSEAKDNLAQTSVKLQAEEVQSIKLQETLASEQAKFSALELELADERDQLNILRSKFAEGETGSEALRNRVEEEERKVLALSEELAASRSQVGSLDEEMRSLSERLRASQAKFDSTNVKLEARTMRAKDLTQRLYAHNDRLLRLLERLSYSITREGSSMAITKIPRLERSSANDSSDPGSAMRRSISGPSQKALVDSGDLDLLYWMQGDDPDVETEKYEAYLNALGNFDMEAFCECIVLRIKETERVLRKVTRDARSYRDKSHSAQKEAHEKIAFKHFKEGDLALFLPTRNQNTGAWAAFNVGAPHYFLREQDAHKLRTRDWLLARIQRVDDRVVDLSKSMTANHTLSNAGDHGSIGEASNGGDSYDDDNPFELSDGLRWYLIDAVEEKPGAPSTPGLGKSTVAATNIDATGSIRRTKKSPSGGVDDVSKTLSRSLDSRRSSNNSKKAVPYTSTPTKAGPSSLIDTSKIGSPPADGSSHLRPDNVLGIKDARPTVALPPQLNSNASSNLEVTFFPRMSKLWRQ
jgi:autophagy-related protein 11